MLSEMPSQRAPTRPSNIAVIEACTMLNSLTADERMELASQSFMAFAERGEMIWAAGSPSEFSAVVGTGFIKMSKKLLLSCSVPGRRWAFLQRSRGAATR